MWVDSRLDPFLVTVKWVLCPTIMPCVSDAKSNLKRADSLTSTVGDVPDEYPCLSILEWHCNACLSRYSRLVENELQCITVAVDIHLWAGAKCSVLLSEPEILTKDWVMYAL